MPIGFRRTAAAAAIGLAVALAGAGGADERPFPDFERDGPVAVGQSQDASDPCLFFRGQAFDKGLADYTREMLWACEEIARRRAARIPLGDRLEATAAMLEAYRDAIIAAGSAVFARSRSAGLPPWALGLSDDEKYAIADATGALLALEAIRLGF